MSYLSAALGYACAAGIAIGLFAALRLLLAPGGGERAERFLGLLLVLCAANVLHGVLDFRTVAEGPFILEPLQFLLPLGIVWHLRALMGRRILEAVDSINLLLPAAFIAASNVPGLLEARLANGIPVLCLAMWLAMDASAALIFVPVARDVHRYRRELEREYSNLGGIDPGWLQRMLFLMGALFFLYALLSVLMVHASVGLPQRAILATLTSAFTILLAWASLGRKRLPSRAGREAEPAAAGADGPGLPGPELLEAAGRLRALLEGERLFLEPELSLDELARAARLTRHEASAALNRGLDASFFDLVNRYRVEEFQRLCRDPARGGDKIMTLALEAGFNSKPNFNLIFKRTTGLTPSQFRKSAGIESRPDD